MRQKEIWKDKTRKLNREKIREKIFEKYLPLTNVADLYWLTSSFAKFGATPLFCIYFNIFRIIEFRCCLKIKGFLGVFIAVESNQAFVCLGPMFV